MAYPCHNVRHLHATEDDRNTCVDYGPMVRAKPGRPRGKRRPSTLPLDHTERAVIIIALEVLAGICDVRMDCDIQEVRTFIHKWLGCLPSLDECGMIEQHLIALSETMN